MALQSATEQNDGALVRRALSGESQAFGRLVEKYQGLIYGLAYNKIGNTADAQDIAQDVFVRAFRKLKQLEDPDSFAAWIKSITANECKTWLRNLRPTVSLDESKYSPVHDSTAQSIWRYDEFRAEVAQAIQALPERNREVITLYYLSGMTCEEIAESLGITPSAVQSRLHRSRQLLRAEFTGEIEQVLGQHRLPESFAEDVLVRTSISALDNGCISGYPARDQGLCAFFMGVPSSDGGEHRIVAITMPEAGAYRVAAARSHFPGDVKLGESLDAELRDYHDRGMELLEVILYLDDREHCMCRAVFRQGRAKRTEHMKPSCALALAHRARVPILAEESVVRMHQVGEDGLHIDLPSSFDDWTYNCMRGAGLCRFQDRIFETGTDTAKGLDTVRVSRDDEQRTVSISVVGLEGARSTMEFGPNTYWVDYVWELAKDNKTIRELQDDGTIYNVLYELHGDEVTIRCSVHRTGCGLSELNMPDDD